MNLTVPRIWLRRSLQPGILALIQRLRKDGYRNSERCATAAHEWNLFRNRPESERWVWPELVEDCWLGWIAAMCRRRRSFTWTRCYLHGLERFFDFLASEGVIKQNLFIEFRKGITFDARNHQRLARLPDPEIEEVRAILGGTRTICSPATHPSQQKTQRKYNSPKRQQKAPAPLPEWMEYYIEFLKNRGRKADKRSTYRRNLRIFNGVLKRHSIESLEELTSEVIQEYLIIKLNKAINPGKPLSNSTRLLRLSTLRGLCRYAHRRGIKVPMDLVERWPRLKRPVFRPHIYTLKEVDAILKAFHQRAAQGSFIWRSCELMVYLLYACGMRSGEARRLNFGEVDLERQLLLVARTKFYKERWVPLGEGATRRLRDYRFVRNQRFPEVTGADDPFFLNSAGRRILEKSFNEPFRAVVDELALRSRGDGAPRAHDLRHTMAVHRFYKWYSEGADVQNKLPLLATYLGHGCYHHTETYLHLTTDLIRQAGRNFQASFEEVVGEVLRGTETS